MLPIRLCRLLIVLFTILLPVMGARAELLVQEFFVPLPEDQVRKSLKSLYGSTGASIESVVSLVVTNDGTVIHYDHWEDGYEVDLEDPSQPTTEIWGDGIDANGKPPSFSSDPANGLTRGQVVFLRNSVSLPRNPATVLYDGRDLLGASIAVVGSRASWASRPGTVLAGAAEILSLRDYGKRYFMPVGEDLSANEMFEYVGLLLVAAEDATNCDLAGNPLPTLNRGSTFQQDGGVMVGDELICDKPVQAHLITGDIGTRYESRWFLIYPEDVWSNEYFSPVGTAADGDQSFVFVYNPSDAPITVHYETLSGSGNFEVSANDTHEFQLPTASGGRFYTEDDADSFYALVTVGANPRANNVHDWGLPLVPRGALTTEIVTGWGPGDGGSTPSTDGSPLWVSSTDTTTLYVDFDGDGGASTAPNGQDYDETRAIDRLESLIINDPDHDHTGTRVFTVDGTLITGAWGQNPAVAGAGNPYLDMGTAVLPFPVPSIIKSAELIIDGGDAGVPNVDDTLRYTLTINNAGLATLPSSVVKDAVSGGSLLPAGIEYKVNTTTLNAAAVDDDISGTTAFPLDEGGFNIPSIPAGTTSTISYDVVIKQTGTWVNRATLENPDVYSEHTLIVPARQPVACTVDFASNVAGTVAGSYVLGDDVFIKLDDSDLDLDSNSAEQLVVSVNNEDNGDVENLVLAETGLSSGIFINATGLPTSSSSGQVAQSGVIFAATGDTLSVSYQDPYLGDTCNDTVSFPPPTETKKLYFSDDGNSSDGSGDLDRRDPSYAGHSDSDTDQTATLGGSTALLDVTVGNIDASVNAAIEADGSLPISSITVSHQIGGGEDRLLLVSVAFEDDETGDLSVSGVTFGGQALTLANAANDASSEARAQIYYLLDANFPSGTGSRDVVVSFINGGEDDDEVVIGANTFTGVDQVDPFGNFETTFGVGTSASGNITLAAGELAFGLLAVDDSRGATATAGTNLWNADSNAPGQGITASVNTASGTGNQTLSWDSFSTSDNWALTIVAIKPTSSVIFTQAIEMASTLSIPAGKTISAIAYVSESTGLTDGNVYADITAVLSYQPSTGSKVEITTLGEATYSAGALRWTSSALANDVDIPAGAAVELVVSNGQAGTSLKIDYDSADSPSRVELPTTTVISVDSLTVYDAPYPGGVSVSDSSNGQTLYVRSTVSDPFGAYDINPAGDPMSLTITNSSDAGCDITTTLDDGFVVEPVPLVGDEASKTYEYVWVTSSCEGSYSVSVTAHEGNEDEISHSSAMALNLSPLDVGTPSFIAFIDNNGDDRTAYGAGEQVCLRVTDLDEAGESNSVSVSVSASGSAASPLSLTLTAISSGSGVFEGCFNDGSGNPDHTFVEGDILRGTYADDDDPDDVVTDTAIVTDNSVPGLLLSKSLISPSGGGATVGDTVEYRLTAINSGAVTLNTLTLSDAYPSSCYRYDSASVAPDNSGDNPLVWSGLGPIASGASVSFVVRFQAIDACDSNAAKNTLSASGDVSAGPVESTVNIARPEVTVTKTTSVATATIGDTVNFDIDIENTGSSSIKTLPLSDSYSTCLKYVSATPEASSAGGGVALWSDLGSLAVGATASVSVTFDVVGACDPAQNLAEVGFAVDENDRSVPSAQDGATLATEAAAIRGRVLNDINANGQDDTEQGIAAVKISLFEGVSSAGNLLATTKTSSDGAYEFPSVGNGVFTVVERDLSGFVSTTDKDAGEDLNAIQVEIQSLADSTGNDFLDVESGQQGITLTKTVFETGASGANCTNATDELVYVDADRSEVDVTWCFAVENTGDLPLTDLVITDTELGLTTLSQFTKVSGDIPLEPGSPIVYRFEETGRTDSLINTATAAMKAGELPVTDENTATFAYVFDPPFGTKTGTLNGQTRIRWTMVWINDNPIEANGVVITDEIDATMQYIPGTLTCTPAGSVTEVPDGCSDANVSGQLLSITANFGPDLGATTAASADNELVISFDATVVDPSQPQTLQNQGSASWTPPGCSTGDCPLIGTTDSDTDTNGDQPTDVMFTPVVPPAPVPAIPISLLALMSILLAGLGWRCYKNF